MNTYEVVSLSRVTEEYWRLHRAGCADVAKDADSRANVTTIEAASAREAAAEFIDEELTEMGYTTNDIKILPCAR